MNWWLVLPPHRMGHGQYLNLKWIWMDCIMRYEFLSSTWCKFDPNTAYVHIHMHWVFLIWYPCDLDFLIWYPYALVSWYGDTAHYSGYGVALGCYGLFIVPRTAIVTSLWYDRYCFMEYALTWARHPTVPWQHECTAIILLIDRIFIGFIAICYIFLRFIISKLHYCCVNYIFVLEKRNPSGSQRSGPTCGPPCGCWLPSGRMPAHIT